MKPDTFILIILSVAIVIAILMAVYYQLSPENGLEGQLELYERELDQDYCFKKCDRLSWQIETDWTGERWIMCVDECLTTTSK